MTKRGTLVVIGGPTASGKTHAAATLAKQLGTEVISGDSRQFYHAMRIGTARPSETELLGVRHHFLGHLDLEQAWSAGAFARAAEPVLQGLIATKGYAVLVGGSGLYADALLKGLDPLPTGDPGIRKELQHRVDRGEMPAMLQELKGLDPETWQRIDRANPHRVIRALEVCMITGRPYSEQRTAPTDRTDLRIVRLAMDLPRTELYQRIDRRVDEMVLEGLVDEVRSVSHCRNVNALRTVGYREMFEHLDGTLDLHDAIALIKQHTRNFAKRQLTWLRRDVDWRWVHPTDHAAHLRLATGN